MFIAMSCCLFIALPEILCCAGPSDGEDDLSFRTATSQSFGSSASARVGLKDPPRPPVEEEDD